MILLSLFIMMVSFFVPTIMAKKFDFYYPSSFLAITFSAPVTAGSYYYLQIGAFSGSEDTNLLLLLCILVMSICYVGGYIFFSNPSKNICISILNQLTLNLVEVRPRINMLLSIMLGMYLFILAILIYLTELNPIADPLWFRIKASHDYGVLYAVYQYIPIYLLVYAFYFKLINNGAGNQIIYALIVLSSLLFMFFSGSRGMFAQAIFVLFILRKVFEKKELSWSRVIICGFLLAFFFIWYQLYRILETVDIIILIKVLSDFSLDNTMLWEVVLRYDVLFNFYKVLVQIDKGNIAMLYGQSIWDVFLMFVPRSIYTDKPFMTNMEIHKYFSSETASGVLDFNSGYMMAEAFLNFHVFGIMLYSIFWGMFMVALDSQYRKGLSNCKFASGFLLFYLPAMLYTSFPQDGFNGMFFQQIAISFILTLIQVAWLRGAVKIKKEETKV